MARPPRWTTEGKKRLKELFSKGTTFEEMIKLEPFRSEKRTVPALKTMAYELELIERRAASDVEWRGKKAQLLQFLTELVRNPKAQHVFGTAIELRDLYLAWVKVNALPLELQYHVKGQHHTLSAKTVIECLHEFKGKLFLNKGPLDLRPPSAEPSVKELRRSGGLREEIRRVLREEVEPLLREMVRREVRSAVFDLKEALREEPFGPPMFGPRPTGPQVFGQAPPGVEGQAEQETPVEPVPDGEHE